MGLILVSFVTVRTHSDIFLMMSVLVLVCLLTIWIPTTLSTTTSISKQPFKIFIKNCQTESGATKDDFETIKMRKLPETKTGRCFLECLFNKAKIMNDGKFSKQGMVIAFSTSTKGDPAKLRQLKELADVCDKEMGDKKMENCEGVQMVVECIARNGKAYGIDLSRHANM